MSNPEHYLERRIRENDVQIERVNKQITYNRIMLVIAAIGFMFSILYPWRGVLY